MFKMKTDDDVKLSVVKAQTFLLQALTKAIEQSHEDNDRWVIKLNSDKVYWKYAPPYALGVATITINYADVVFWLNLSLHSDWRSVEVGRDDDFKTCKLFSEKDGNYELNDDLYEFLNQFKGKA